MICRVKILKNSIIRLSENRKVISLKFKKSYLNWSAWITLILTYVLPYQSTDGFATKFGYPIPFLTTHDVPIDTTLLKSLDVNILSLAIDIMIVYFVINFAYGLVVKFKSNKDINQRID